MKFLKRYYKISIEDEAHLYTVAQRRIPVVILWLSLALVAVLVLFALMFLVLWSPLGNDLPISIAESRRVEMQQTAIRIDSLSQILEHNRAWFDNFAKVTNLNREPSDSAAYARIVGEYNPDQLADASLSERNFVSSMEERERFNISVLAPLDADGMAFAPVNPHVLFESSSRNSSAPRLIIPDNSPIQTIADGTVLAAFRSPGMQGFTILVQHGRGFVSGYFHTGTPLVTAGDVVNAGQPLSFSPDPDKSATRWIDLRIWHNGTTLIPAQLISPES